MDYVPFYKESYGLKTGYDLSDESNHHKAQRSKCPANITELIDIFYGTQNGGQLG